MSLSGLYFRKRVETWNPSDGWQRKWTYKIGWVGSSDSPRAMAMTDGMVISFKSKGNLYEWIAKNDMVAMSSKEMVGFIINDSGNLTDSPYYENWLEQEEG